VIGFATRPRRLAVNAFAVALAIAVAAAGCGSSDDATSGKAPGAVVAGSDGSGPSSNPQNHLEANEGSGEDGARAGDGRAGAQKGSPIGADRSGGPKQGNHGHAGGQAQAPDGSIERVAAKHCPKGTELAQCEALARDAEQMRNAPSYSITKPEDCLKTMSQSECEATYAAQKQAAESNGASVDVQACLKNPTPECEAVVRPLLERQRAAEEAGR
jgi:hypothetical protein